MRHHTQPSPFPKFERALWSGTIAATFCAVLVASVASAGSKSLITFGLGTSVGVSRHTPMGQDTKSAFSGELNLKLKMLHCLAVEFAYSPVDKLQTGDALTFDSRFRISAALYIIPTYPVNVYLKGGLGGGKFTDTFKAKGETTSYHAGAGLDWHIGDHFVLGAEFLLLIPGVTSITQTLSTQVTGEIARYQERQRMARVAGALSASEPEPTASNLSVKDFISPKNFRVAITARYFF